LRAFLRRRLVLMVVCGGDLRTSTEDQERHAAHPRPSRASPRSRFAAALAHDVLTHQSSEHMICLLAGACPWSARVPHCGAAGAGGGAADGGEAEARDPHAPMLSEMPRRSSNDRPVAKLKVRSSEAAQ